MSTRYNCHVHVFTTDNVPDGFLPLGLMRLLRRGPVAKAVDWVMRKWPFDTHGRVAKTAAFARTGRATAADIFRSVEEQYPADTRFVVLPMDMEYMGCGRAPQSYTQQLETLRALHLANPETIIPFIAVDPRRPRVLELVKEYVEVYGFRGIKLYPPLGYWPFDERLDPVYEYAQARGLPVLTHCSRGGVFYQGPITGDMRRHPLTGERIAGSNDRFSEAYAHPDNYGPVVRNYPRLRICLAHWGGGDEWKAYLKTPWPVTGKKPPKSWLACVTDMVRAHENVYTDIAYTACDSDYLPFIKVLCSEPSLASKVLYGSDWYMVQRDATEREFSINLRAFVGEEVWNRITVDNPQRFLGSATAGVLPLTLVTEPTV